MWDPDPDYRVASAPLLFAPTAEPWLQHLPIINLYATMKNLDSRAACCRPRLVALRLRSRDAPPNNEHVCNHLELRPQQSRYSSTATCTALTAELWLYATMQGPRLHNCKCIAPSAAPGLVALRLRSPWLQRPHIINLYTTMWDPDCRAATATQQLVVLRLRSRDCSFPE